MDKDLGTWGEEQAVRFLVRRGYRLLERNYRVWEGEIDMVAENEGKIIFVEVKTRISDRFGTPEESIDESKWARLYRAGWHYLDAHSMPDKPFQFDLIAIKCSPQRTIDRLNHYQDVIGMNGSEACLSAR